MGSRDMRGVRGRSEGSLMSARDWNGIRDNVSQEKRERRGDERERERERERDKERMRLKESVREILRRRKRMRKQDKENIPVKYLLSYFNCY